MFKKGSIPNPFSWLTFHNELEPMRYIRGHALSPALFVGQQAQRQAFARWCRV